MPLSNFALPWPPLVFVAAIALAIVRDVPASEDIAQEAFLSAWQNLRRLQNPASFLPWLRQITRNLARDHLRARRRLPREADDADAAIEAAADPRPDPDSDCEQKLTRVSATEARFTLACKTEAGRMTGEGRVWDMSPTGYRMKMSMKLPGGQMPAGESAEMSHVGRWLGADCKGVAPSPD